MKIGIVEDEMIIADYLADTLVDIGYEVPQPAARYSEAIELLENETPDLLLLDINLTGKLDGIDLAETVNRQFGIPFIFVTANTDAGTIERAKKVRPAAYLAKPITKEQLYSAIEIALNNSATSAVPQHIPVKDYIFVKDGYLFRKVFLNEILYLESEHNYVALHLTGTRKILVRSSLAELHEQVGKTAFIQIHRSYIVNTALVENVSSSEVAIKDVKLPLGKTYREQLIIALGIRE